MQKPSANYNLAGAAAIPMNPEYFDNYFQEYSG